MQRMNGKMGKFIKAGVYILLSTILAACQQQNQHQGKIPRAEIEKLIKKSVHIINVGDMEAVHGVYAPDLIRHEQDYSEPRVGIEQFKEQIQRIRKDFSHFALSINDLIIENDKAVVRWTVDVVRPKPTKDDPQAEEKGSFTGVTISRVKNAQIAEQWVYYDTASVLARLGYQVTPTKSSAR